MEKLSSEQPFKHFLLMLIAFFAGFSVMVVEMTANRVLAPWFGNSLYTWTSLIGVILIALSVGYYFGGKLADKYTEKPLLSGVLAFSGLTVMLIPLLVPLLDDQFSTADLIAGPVMSCVLLFILPGLSLGSVTPIVIRQVSLQSNDNEVGASAGKVSALSTIGSVIGTFAAGFVLIPMTDIRFIFLAIGIGLGICSLVSYLSHRRQTEKIKPIFILLMLPLFALLSIAVVFQVQQKDSSVLYEKNNFYHRVRVLNQFFNHKGNVTVLMLDTTYEGGQFNQSSRPLFPYHNAWQFIRLLEKPEHVLFLGGGAYSMPKLMSSAYPETIIEVVEVDPDVVDVGRKYFEIDQFKMLKPKVDDARHYLSRTVQRYDMIVGDVYHGIRSIPAHFTTQEFFKTVDQKLKAEGFFLMNIVSSIQGRQSEIFKTMLKTVASVFQFQSVYATNSNLDQLQNILILVSQNDLSDKLQQLSSSNQLESLLRNKVSISNIKFDQYKLLTDFDNPIEYLVSKSLSNQ